MKHQVECQAEYQQSLLIKTLQNITQKKLDPTKTMILNTALSDSWSTQMENNLQADLKEIRKLLNEINFPEKNS